MNAHSSCAPSDVGPIGTTFPLLALTEIKKGFGEGEGRVQALDGITLHIQSGEFCALSGPSGSGKSTLLNILGLLDQADSGSYFFDGQTLKGASEKTVRSLRQKHFGFVFQSFNLVQTLSAVENVEMALFHAPMKAGVKRKQASEMLDLVGLGERLNHRPNQLSGGQQQRVAVARALVRQPRLVFADEPTANLDAASAFGLMDLMDDMRRQIGTSFITSTHDNRLMDRFSRIISLEDGRILP
ncbi:ABC transporter ATP-binding protein [Sulfitobacter sp. F26204]|uniref:ABC transporter ATP-binding protein n=1 Tax=Sulfitobacter sp. F26204 TaxID=2996014 RepID=UPI00225E677C|nr:ABC transporter ATP-binding protein [Sulfitobacter sp. F26204]MCX7560546.1 ABC transporter ATP-binding protein [Sulfitobacter sp. F26204]